MTIPSAIIRRVEDKVLETYLRAQDLFGRSFEVPSISWSLYGCAAGRASIHANRIELNPVLLLENVERFIAQTVPHEVAHLVNHALHGDHVRPHGPQWKAIMRAFGIPPVRCHEYEIPAGATRGFERTSYYCTCRIHLVSQIIHNRIRRGAKYRCRQCGMTISFRPPLLSANNVLTVSTGSKTAMNDEFPGFVAHDLGGCSLWVGQLPNELLLNTEGFEDLWNLHPQEFSKIKMGLLQRWQQAYGKSYYFSGQVNRALEIPSILQAYLSWAQMNVNQKLNGLLLNWYDGELGHYIGPHRDSVKNMASKVPIVTISLGEARVFRMRPWKREGAAKDFDALNGTVFILPQETNKEFTHEVPRFSRFKGRRISVTLRGFEGDLEAVSD